MAISEAQRSAIVELAHRGRSHREIASEVGVSKDTVGRVLKRDTIPKGVSKSVSKNEDSPHARASVACPDFGAENKDKIRTAENRSENPPEVSPIAPVMMTQDLAVNELMVLLSSSKETLRRARTSYDGTPSSINAEVSAVKAVRDVLRLIGEWCGLDDAVRIVDVTPTVHSDNVDDMDLETMRRMVRDL